MRKNKKQYRHNSRLEEESVVLKLKIEFENLYKEDKYEESLAVLDKLPQSYRDDPQYKKYRGFSLFKLKKFKESIECFDKICIDNLFDNDTNYYCCRGAAFVELGNFDQAFVDLDLSFKKNNNNPWTFYWKGMAFLNQSKYEKCLEILNEYLNRRVNSSNNLYDLSVRDVDFLERSVNREESEISMNPHFTYFFILKALCMIGLGKVNEALTEIDKAINGNSDIREFFSLKAACLKNLGKYSEALIEIERAYEINSKKQKAIDPEDHEKKGLILYHLKKEDEAIDYLMKSLNTNEKPKQEVLDIMDSIIKNLKKNVSSSSLINSKGDLDECIKILTEINKIPVKLDIASFSSINYPIPWKEIQIEKESILNYQDIHDDFFCKICFSLLKNPKCCQACDEMICSKCLEDSVERNNSCPNCRINPFKESKINRIIKKNFDLVHVRCPLKCSENIHMQSLEKHLNECENREIFYKCDICKVDLDDEEQVKKHENICPELNFECPFCKEKFKNKEIKQHMSSCDMRLEVCEICLCKIPFKYQNSHKEYFCNVLSSMRKLVVKASKNLIEF